MRRGFHSRMDQQRRDELFQFPGLFLAVAYHLLPPAIICGISDLSPGVLHAVPNFMIESGLGVTV